MSLVMSAAEAVRAAEEPPVTQIEVQGLTRIQEAVVLARLTQRTGVPVSVDAVTADLKSIYALGYFDDVRVEVEPSEGGLRLIYLVKEKPNLRRVEVFGYDHVDKEKINEKLTLTPGSMADNMLIESNAEALRKLYESEGYPLAVVLPVLRDTVQGQTMLTFHIVEGPKVKIDTLNFRGNEVFSNYRLGKQMETSEWWLLSWLTSAGNYSREELNKDTEKLKEYYHDRGYVKAVVYPPEVRFQEDREWLDIDIRIEEGAEYTVKDFSFEGGGNVLTQEELRALVKLKPGEPVSRKRITEDSKELTDALAEKGYALATVYPKLEVEEEGRTVSVKYMLTEGDLYRVGRLESTGNYKTRDKVIRREFLVDEGDLFNGKKLKLSYQNLNNLNYFEDLRINPEPDYENKLLNIKVIVKEKSTGTFNVGGGYSTVDKLIGMADITLGNLDGRGQSLKAKTEFSAKSTTYELEFKDPWLFDKPLSFNASLFKTTKEYDDYKKYSKGSSLGLARRFMDYWRVGSSYTLEWITIADVESETANAEHLQEGTTLTSSITPYVQRSTLDNYLMPHTGTDVQTSVTFAGLGGDNKFFKWQIDGKVVTPVTEQTEFSARARYGYATGILGATLPLYERFYVGSSYTVRGLRDIGPKDSGGDYVGGAQRVIFNFDYTYPLAPEARLKGDVFFDAGTAFDSSIDMRYSAGLGLFWLSPLGPLSLNWAKNLEPRDAESSSRWEFSIGTFF